MVEAHTHPHWYVQERTDSRTGIRNEMLFCPLDLVHWSKMEPPEPEPEPEEKEW